MTDSCRMRLCDAACPPHVSTCKRTRKILERNVISHDANVRADLLIGDTDMQLVSKGPSTQTFQHVLEFSQCKQQMGGTGQAWSTLRIAHLHSGTHARR